MARNCHAPGQPGGDDGGIEDLPEGIHGKARRLLDGGFGDATDADAVIDSVQEAMCRTMPNPTDYPAAYDRALTAVYEGEGRP